jgi:hypothetical protein
MEMVVCPHCGSLQRQTADLGTPLQCESCHKPFVVAPEEAESSIPMDSGTVAHGAASILDAQGTNNASGSRYKSGLLVANIVLVVGWLLAIVGIFTILTSFTARSYEFAAILTTGIGALVGGMVAVLLAHACRAVMHTADYSRMLLEKLSSKK